MDWTTSLANLHTVHKTNTCVLALTKVPCATSASPAKGAFPSIPAHGWSRFRGGIIKPNDAGKSLDKISGTLDINKKAAFDWRHKILASLEAGRDDFTGIIESDVAFFRSEKGMDVKGRKSRKRGGKSTKRGISDDQVAVIVTQVRKSALDLNVATLGRIGKADLENARGCVKKGSSILWSDAHHSYKGLAKNS